MEQRPKEALDQMGQNRLLVAYTQGAVRFLEAQDERLTHIFAEAQKTGRLTQVVLEQLDLVALKALTHHAQQQEDLSIAKFWIERMREACRMAASDSMVQSSLSPQGV